VIFAESGIKSIKPNLILLPQLLPVISNVSGSLYLSKAMTERTRNVIVYNIRISLGSVATRLRFGGNVNNTFIVNCLQSVKVTKLLKSVNIWRIYGQRFSGTFLRTTVGVVHCIYNTHSYFTSLLWLHPLYAITQCYLPPDTDKHAPPRQTGTLFSYPGAWRDGRLSCPRCWL